MECSGNIQIPVDFAFVYVCVFVSCSVVVVFWLRRNMYYGGSTYLNIGSWSRVDDMPPWPDTRCECLCVAFVCLRFGVTCVCGGGKGGGGRRGSEVGVGEFGNEAS